MMETRWIYGLGVVHTGELGAIHADRTLSSWGMASAHARNVGGLGVSRILEIVSTRVYAGLTRRMNSALFGSRSRTCAIYLPSTRRRLFINCSVRCRSSACEKSAA